MTRLNVLDEPGQTAQVISASTMLSDVVLGATVRNRSDEQLSRLVRAEPDVQQVEGDAAQRLFVIRRHRSARVE